MMGQFQPLERQTFGRLAVVSLSPARVGQKGAFWLCRCQCGAEKPVRAAALRSGNTKSCGCLKLDRMTKHGAHRTAEYQIWRGMKDRCGRPKRARYESYGGKGVRVCERWRDSFENFLADMGPRPGPAYSIERDDNDGDYEPRNCRWATTTEQSRHKAMQRNNASGVTGVAWAKREGKWRATIGIKGRNKWLGDYDSLAEATKARKDAEIAHEFHPQHGARAMASQGMGLLPKEKPE